MIWDAVVGQVGRRSSSLPPDRVLLYAKDFALRRADAARRFMRAYVRTVRFYNGALNGGRLDGPNAEEVIAILSEATPTKSRDISKGITPTSMNPDGRVNRAEPRLR
jgi:NitT/TauT family transport system substrate-binding protein